MAPRPLADVPVHEPPDTPGIGMLPAAGVSLSAVGLFGLQLSGWGHALLVVSLIGAFLISRELAKDLALIGIGIAILSTTSVRADVDWDRFVTIGTVLLLAVAVPLLVDRVVHRRRAIRFPWLTGQPWTRLEKGYIVAVPVLGWLILPFYFITSGAYENWPHITGGSELARFFVGVSFVGTWDELFFICTCFALLRRHVGLWTANVLQAIIFVSFLWELGYQEWGPLLTAPFALLQGWLFTRTGSLLYVLIVHLLFDVVVFLAIVHAHNPGAIPIFLV
ncbi:abortive phage infection protein [Brachybacterium sp. P6-10-X1]|uniref:CPBP family intramembrane glutamic endopeptidase n=1 Tax=Brachybacterium sp. P6-10-X1 TaxID=1903186 RepID=UPI0009718015|nr:CPBP family intramembrane glutamic endopeptidase [Brachybacterium sp. P6-10-X1]APX35031.1 abortive phage infection protein [Brachybacterium sp. P6-10-X1]